MKRKIVSMMLVIAMAAVALVGCNQTEDKKDTPNVSDVAEDETPAEKKEISVLILDRGKCSADEGTMEENRWTEWINENSPVKVNWVSVPRNESSAKVNALFSSDAAPDLVWEFGRTFMDNLYNQGVIQPVDEYIEQYSTEYKAYLEEHPELKPYLVEDDGQMYAFTSARSELSIVNHGMWIRQDWLDNLGLEMPKTVEDLYNVALAFTKNDPDGNGIDDTVGIAFNYNGDAIFRTLFGCTENNNPLVVDENGQVSLWTGSDAYAQCFEMRKAMYENGIIDAEYVTDTSYERETQLFTTGKAGIYFAGWDIEGNWRSLKENCPEANLVPLEAVAAPDGNVYGLYQEPAPFRHVCMNAKAEDPEACIEFLDWMLTEGWYAMTYGLEGEHYTLVDGYPQSIDADKTSEEVAYAYEYPTLMDQQIDDLTTYLQTIAASDDLSQEYAALKASSIETIRKHEYRRDLPYAPVVEEWTNFKTELNTTLGSIEAQMITDPNYSVEQGVKDVIAARDAAGYEATMEAVQAWYDANKDILN